MSDEELAVMSAALRLAGLHEMPATTRHDVTRAELELRAAARRYWAEKRMAERAAG